MKRSIAFHCLILVSLSLALSVCSSSVRSRALLISDDAVGAPSPLAGDSIEYRMNTTDERPQQNIVFVLMAGVIICFAVFMLSCCLAYKTIVVRQEEMNRRHRSRVGGMTFNEQDIHGGREEEGVGGSNADGLDAGLVRSLPSVQYKSGMVKPEEETKAGGGPLQNVMRVKECAVCLSEYEEGEEMKVLPVCGHCFHEACISMWLSSHSTCPICRLSLRKNAETMPPADTARR